MFGEKNSVGGKEIEICRRHRAATGSSARCEWEQQQQKKIVERFAHGSRSLQLLCNSLLFRTTSGRSANIESPIFSGFIYFSLSSPSTHNDYCDTVRSVTSLLIRLRLWEARRGKPFKTSCDG
ncbi:hypothetical protein CBR_g37618 [Chara braunii]|uniref:Uncharacterized protein n=1 Tax=Chara braunii TaxID=69332 RepID=A0A388LNC5_CHABU|nr:hypothetical protein CBR_g37618 [Chara braunii]|eukprot:GBG83818.1 hypothetical protein CBR_g37618 [Chara braunii]